VVRKVVPSGIITTFAGTGVGGFGGDGGLATKSYLSFPNFVVADAVGNLYISDSGNYRVRKVSPSGTISTVAGNGSAGSSGDGGLATNASIDTPQGLAVDAAGNLFIASAAAGSATSGANVVRKVAPNGTITTVAGDGKSGYSGDGGSATSAALTAPRGLAVDAAGDLFIADWGNNRIRR